MIISQEEKGTIGKRKKYKTARNYRSLLLLCYTQILLCFGKAVVTFFINVIMFLIILFYLGGTLWQ